MSFPHELRGFTKITSALLDNRQVTIGLSKLAVGCDTLAEVGLGFIKPTSLHEKRTQVVGRLAQVGRDGHRSTVHGLGFGESAFALMDLGDLQQHWSFVGSRLKAAFKRCESAVEIT